MIIHLIEFVNQAIRSNIHSKKNSARKVVGDQGSDDGSDRKLYVAPLLRQRNGSDGRAKIRRRNDEAKVHIRHQR